MPKKYCQVVFYEYRFHLTQCHSTKTQIYRNTQTAGYINLHFSLESWRVLPRFLHQIQLYLPLIPHLNLYFSLNLEHVAGSKIRNVAKCKILRTSAKLMGIKLPIHTNM